LFRLPAKVQSDNGAAVAPLKTFVVFKTRQRILEILTIGIDAVVSVVDYAKIVVATG
jgi:hypothetical protein